MKLLFDVGDIVKINSVTVQTVGQIVALRHAIGNARTGDLSFGADVLCADGKTRFRYLHDLARWNPTKLEALHAATA